MTNFTFTAKYPDGATYDIKGIETGTIELNLDGPDTATLIGPVPTLDQVNTNAEITIKHGATTILVGDLIANEVISYAGVERDRSLKIIGHKNWLNRVTYCQQWLNMTAEGPEQIYSSRLILNAYKSGGAILPLDARYQLADIINYVATVGAPLQGSDYSGIVPGQPPIEEQRDLTAAQAIARVIRLVPGAAYYADYTTTPPTIRFLGPNPGPAYAPPRTLTHTATNTTLNSHAPSGVIVEVERLHDIAGTQYRTIELQTYGDTTKPNTARVSFQPAGSIFNPNAKSLDVDSELVGAYTTEAWWKAKHPNLKNIDLADIQIVAGQATRGPNPTDYPYICHTPLPDLTAAGLKARLETFRATVNLTRRDSGAIIGVDHAIELELQLVTTDAWTKTYRWTQGAEFQTQEELPIDLAYHIYHNFTKAYRQGTLVTTCADGLPTLGQSYLSTHIRHISIDIATQTVTTQYGPPPQLTAADISAALAAFRGAPPVHRLDSRFDGQPPAKYTDNPAIIAPAQAATITPGIPRRTVLRTATGSAAIDLNPTDDLASGDTAKLRPLTIVDANGDLKEIKALVTAPATPTSPDLQEVTAPIAIQVALVSGQPRLQVKYGKVLAKDISTTWTDLITPVEFDT